MQVKHEHTDTCAVVYYNPFLIFLPKRFFSQKLFQFHQIYVFSVEHDHDLTLGRILQEGLDKVVNNELLFVLVVVTKFKKIFLEQSFGALYK